MIVIALLSLVSLVYGQTSYVAFTADFIATAPQWGTGYFTGKFAFDWNNGMMQLSFDNADGLVEFYVFNSDRGYNPNVATGQFTYQYLYTTSDNCPCETTAVAYAMPPLFGDSVLPTVTDPFSQLTYWDLTTKLSSNDGKFQRTDPCIKYPANTGFYLPPPTSRAYYIASFFYIDTQGIPAGFLISDVQQRTFTFSNVQSATPGSLGLIAPTTGCKCGKMLDIVLSLDRSGSIQEWQWDLEFEFTKNLTQNFEYGALQTNIGIVDWNAAFWSTLDILSGINYQNVYSAVNSMTCCGTPSSTTASCCCCGTPIGGGIWLGANMLAESPRTKATKVLIVLTDGCQNHVFTPPNTATPCPCPTEKACDSDMTCRNDITYWYNWAIDEIPGVTILAVGVGGPATICSEQLQMIAGGDPTKVYNPQSWYDLQTIVQTISATACTTNATLCPGCCGICTCGVCYPAANCLSPDACNIGYLDNSTQCCSSQPIICPIGPCQYATCDSVLGCQNYTVTCKPKQQCYEWYCNATSVVCATRPLSPLPEACISQPPPPQCVTDSDCLGNDLCIKNTCAVNGTCLRTVITCQPSNKCNTTGCRPGSGCYVETRSCDDKNACTQDSCDANLGCLHTNITCKQPTDPCKRTICDTTLGCIEIPITCNLTAGNCSIPACNKTCYLQYTCYTPGPTSSETFPTNVVVLASSLGAAAVAGIVIGAIVLVAGVGSGAVVAIVGAGAGGGVVSVMSNPVYVAAGTGGSNPLNKDC